jgi:hypothetical protein
MNAIIGFDGLKTVYLKNKKDILTAKWCCAYCALLLFLIWQSGCWQMTFENPFH